MNLVDHLADQVLNTTSDAIVVADRNGVVRFWNPGAVRIFGYSAEEAIGRPLDQIIPENLRARHAEGYERVMNTGVTRYGSGDILAVPAMTKDGRRISVEFTIVMLRDDSGQMTGIAAVLRDVTPRFDELRGLRRQLAELTRAAQRSTEPAGE